MNLTIPDPLKKGDMIGFVSPAAGLAPFAMHRIAKAKEFFEKLGYGVKIPKNALKNAGYVSAPVEDRLGDLHDLFRDKSVKAVISTIGGFISNQLLEGLDYKMITRNPKIFVGYSDLTSLHFALQKKAHLSTYYGPCLMTQFGENPQPLEYTANSFFESLTTIGNKKARKHYQSELWTDEVLDWFKKEDLKRARKQQKNKGYVWLRKGHTRGFAWGGTIPTINGLVGTDYWVDCKGGIFFLDIPEGPDINSGLPLAQVDSYLTHLKLMGLFRSIRGLIVGRPYKYSEDELKELNKIVLAVTAGTAYPILTLANIGHVDPIITLRYGSTIVLDSAKSYFEEY